MDADSVRQTVNTKMGFQQILDIPASSVGKLAKHGEVVLKDTESGHFIQIRVRDEND